MSVDIAPATIAIVDDDKTFRFVFSVQILELNDANKVFQFEDGYGMLEFLLENKENPEALPDIIFLDLAMKQVDGWVFLEEYQNIKKYLPKDIVIHIITGSTEEQDRVNALKNNNVSHFLWKPIDNAKLKSVLLGA